MDESVRSVGEISRPWHLFQYQMLTYDRFTMDLKEDVIIERLQQEVPLFVIVIV